MDVFIDIYKKDLNSFLYDEPRNIMTVFEDLEAVHNNQNNYEIVLYSELKDMYGNDVYSGCRIFQEWIIGAECSSCEGEISFDNGRCGSRRLFIS